MRNILVAGILSLLFSVTHLNGFSQKDSVLKISVTRHKSLIAKDQENMEREFDGMLKFIKSKDSSFPFKKTEYMQRDYEDGPEELRRNAIATINPLKYVKFKYEQHIEISPIFVTKKRGELIPYYQAIFIASAKSGIDSVASEKVKTIYLVASNSASGYLYPLIRLHELMLIKKPTLEELKKRYRVVFCKSHRSVEDSVRADTTSIGATWDYSGWATNKQTEVRPIMRYGCIPQDPLVISDNLLPYKKYIIEWFRMLLEKPAVVKESFCLMEITGLAEYYPENENSFLELYKTYTDMKPGNSIETAIVAKYQTRMANVALITRGLTLGCVFSFLFMLVCCYKFASNNNKKYSTLAWGCLTVFTLLFIELLRFVFDLNIENYPTNSSHILTIIAGIALSFLAEGRQKFCRFVMSILVGLNNIIKQIVEGLKALLSDKVL